MKKYFLLTAFPILILNSSWTSDKKTLGSKVKELNVACAVVEDTISSKEIIIKCIQTPCCEFVIRNAKEYKTILKTDSPHPDCGSYELPPIDFNKYTLMGMMASSGGCREPQTEYYIVKNDSTVNYQFHLKIRQNGLCKINFSIQVFCLIPKIDDNAKVEFIVDRKHN